MDFSLKFLGIVETRQGRAFIFDSYPKKKEQYLVDFRNLFKVSTIFAKIKNQTDPILVSQSLDPSDWTFEFLIDAPKQVESFTCGDHCLQFVKLLVTGQVTSASDFRGELISVLRNKFVPKEH